MRSWTIAFCIGILSAYTLGYPLAFFPAAIFFLLLFCIWRIKKGSSRWNKIITGWLVGFIWVCLSFIHVKDQQLTSQLDNRPVTVQGKVVNLPQQYNDYAKFDLALTAINYDGETHLSRQLIQLNWGGFHPELTVGSTANLLVKLKKIHGYADPGSFNIEALDFAEGIDAVGNVEASANNKIYPDKYAIFNLNHFRQTLANRVNQYLFNQPGIAFIEAFLVGVRNHISQQDWNIMSATGTNHLIAIAGLQLGFIAAFAYWFMSKVWRRLGRVSEIIPAPHAANVFALFMAIFYSAMVGFSLPTQRAFLMLTLASIFAFCRRNLSLSQIYLTTLLLLLVWNPLDGLTASFWLSFGAIVLIFYGLSNRWKNSHWLQMIKMQWLLSFGLIPLSLLFFQRASNVSIMANIVAIPAVGFVILPLTVFGGLLFIFCHALGLVFLKIAAFSMNLLWHYLSWLANIPGAVWNKTPKLWQVILSMIGIFICLAPKGFPARYLGLIWCFPLVFFQPATPQHGNFWMTLLDVGQGLSVVVQTQHHALVYDTGPKFSSGFDTGTAVVVPFLQYEGIQHLDALVISHSDNDHIGGAASVLEAIPTADIFTSVPARFKQSAQYCLQGENWNWDGVHFAFLFPNKSMLGLDNNSSCVLKISNADHSVLLTGDIEKIVENYLVSNESSELSSAVLIAPHHGSKTSSSPAFIASVKPQYVLFPVGYDNRYRFPNDIVIQRYLQFGSQLFNTANCGAITIKLNSTKNMKVQCYRKQHQHIWNFSK